MTLAPSATVAVIVPMYNSATTIKRTLRSICRQTYENLDIVVIDDGSTDQGPELVSQISTRDRRIRLIRQPNAGVAAARNHGAVKTAAPYLAFVDADDLWAPGKIAAQMELALEGPPTLVYCWFCQIDKLDRIYRPNYEPVKYEGDVRRQLSRENFIGNGSSMLMHRAVFDQCGGFDATLRAKDAQGCEDYMFAMTAAQFFPFRVVPRRLVGYRIMPGNMSSEAERMVRSFELVAERFLDASPEFATEFDEHHRDFLLWHARRAAMDGALKRVIRMMRRLKEDHGISLLSVWLELAWIYIKARLRPRWAKALAARLGVIVRFRYQEVDW